MIKIATKKEIEKSLSIAKELNEWFTKEAVKNMKIDFFINNLIVSKEKNEVLGFLCYNSYNGELKILWMGVRKNNQRKNIGKSIIDYLEKEAKKQKINEIQVETLPDEDKYEPYLLTRNFYYKNGFKRIAYLKAIKQGWDDQILLENKLK